ncbi:MAG: DUF4175 family protein [Cytophagales bacterium]|nr:hypothetical protein [Bernardetiaceae bacterium]MDW8209716.1 DUF4175 family protein [Cytophagales bacterium]
MGLAKNFEQIQQKLRAYRQKYYKNLLLKGTILTTGAVSAAFITFNGLEHIGNFASPVRAVLFFSFLTIAIASTYFWIAIPLLKLMNLHRSLSNEEAAIQIGKHFPEVSDKLLNLLQLGKLTQQQSDLITASIEQKSRLLLPIDFRAAIDYTQNKRYLRYALPPLLLLLLLAMLVPQFFTDTTPRLIYYSRTFTPKAPFSFDIAENQLVVFKNEDYLLNVNVQGRALPSEVYLIYGQRRIKMDKVTASQFSYTFKNVQKDLSFIVEASGFSSKEYLLQVKERPSMSGFTAYLNYPAYLRKPPEKLSNTGNLIVPQGTVIRWVFNTQQTDKLMVRFQSDSSTIQATRTGNNAFEFSKKAMQSTGYSILLVNPHSQNKDAIEYFLNVIPDEYPTVTLNYLKDTLLYNSITVAGNISDDYGISRLELKYRIVKKGKQPDNQYNSIKINFNPNIISQSYYQELKTEDFGLSQGDKLEYFVQVWDNDGVNGAKSSKTAVQEFSLPDKEEFAHQIERSAFSAKNQMEKALEKAEELKRSLAELQDRLKGKKKLNWQDKQALEELIQRREELTKEIQELLRQNEILNQKQERFTERDREIAEKAQQLSQLIEELLDEETKKLYEELSKLLQKELQDPTMLQNILEEMEKHEKNIARELDRAIEMFKKLQLEEKIKEAIKNLQNLSQEQQQLSEQTKENALPQQELIEKQKEINQKFEQQEKELGKIEDLSKELQNQKQEQLQMEDLKNDQRQVEQKQRESLEQLEQKQNQKASESQRNAAQKMQQMSQKMQQMQQSAETKQQVEDYNALRQILENLVKLSFDQENLMLQFKQVRQEDPRFIELGQQQLKIKDNAKIVEDSLIALSKRVFQIRSFVTREVSNMNDHINQSLEEIKKRRNSVAAAKQQAAMQSINNLALMLDEVLHRMQEQMGQQMGGMQIINKKRKDRQQQQNLSQLQQSLNQQIQELIRSGKQGKELSEQLAKLAAQQEMIRRALKKTTEGKLKQDGKGLGGDIAKLLEEMEKTEEDLVNRRLTQELIKRQREIVTRLLESEKALRERDQEDQREAEHAKPKSKSSPGSYTEYLKDKERQIELLKTVPPSMNPYYKQEVNEYFKKINQNQINN